ncbi:MAG TPA: hypothetical protein VLV83_26235, partial [Acidobacteriota bacterium]|nr:hypothetical protein [Acidobacteriota bacterium]
IEWTVQAEGASGDVTEQTCSVQVVRPGKGKKLEDVDFSHLLDFAQFGAGEGMTSEMILHNPSETRTVNGMIHLMDSEGAPLEVLPHVDGQILRAEGDWSAMPFSIAPMGHFALDASQAQGVRTGSASVRSDGPLAGIVRFTIPGLGTAVLPGSQPVTEALASVRGGAGSHTGAAFRNTEEHPITLRLALRDQQGRPVPGAEAEVSLEAGARQARLLDELFGDALPPEFSGELEIRSQGGSFVAVMLEFGSQPGSFTALPVTPLLKEEPSDKNQQ